MRLSYRLTFIRESTPVDTLGDPVASANRETDVLIAVGYVPGVPWDFISAVHKID
jgi:hypothetical protein